MSNPLKILSKKAVSLLPFFSRFEKKEVQVILEVLDSKYPDRVSVDELRNSTGFENIKGIVQPYESDYLDENEEGYKIEKDGRQYLEKLEQREFQASRRNFEVMLTFFLVVATLFSATAAMNSNQLSERKTNLQRISIGSLEPQGFCSFRPENNTLELTVGNIGKNPFLVKGLSVQAEFDDEGPVKFSKLQLIEPKPILLSEGESERFNVPRNRFNISDVGHVSFFLVSANSYEQIENETGMRIQEEAPIICEDLSASNDKISAKVNVGN